MLKVIQQKGIKAIEPKIGDSYKLGNSTFTIIGPKKYDTKSINKLIKKFSDIGEYNEVASLVSSLDSLKYQYIPVPLNPQESVSALQGILPLLCISYILTQI